MKQYIIREVPTTAEEKEYRYNLIGSYERPKVKYELYTRSPLVSENTDLLTTEIYLGTYWEYKEALAAIDLREL